MDSGLRDAIQGGGELQAAFGRGESPKTPPLLAKPFCRVKRILEIIPFIPSFVLTP